MVAVRAGGRELPVSEWDLPDPRNADPTTDLVAIGADLSPATVLQGYARGLFPMHVSSDHPDEAPVLGWWSPNPRGILPITSMRVTRSLRKSRQRFSTTLDRSFVDVMKKCQRPQEEGQWITTEFIDTYTELHRQGFAHSVEVWNDVGELAGGLYGIELGGLFAGESMFHVERDASKVALLRLVEELGSCPGDRILDVQWRTDHLASLGVIEIPRSDYLDRLAVVLDTIPCLGPSSA